jgi:hypothetical protein
MEVAVRTLEAVDDCLEGAVIESLSAGKDGGLQINLADGRTLLIPDAEIIAVIPRETH